MMIVPHPDSDCTIELDGDTVRITLKLINHYHAMEYYDRLSTALSEGKATIVIEGEP